MASNGGKRCRVCGRQGTRDFIRERRVDDWHAESWVCRARCACRKRELALHRTEGDGPMFQSGYDGFIA